MRHWSLPAMACCLARSSFCAWRQLPGGTRRSESRWAAWTASSFRRARRATSAGTRFAFPVRNSSSVCRSAKVLITPNRNASRDACQRSRVRITSRLLTKSGSRPKGGAVDMRRPTPGRSRRTITLLARQLTVHGDAAGTVVKRCTLATTRRAMGAYFGKRSGCRVVLEAGTHSPWVSRMLEPCGARIGESPGRPHWTLLGRGLSTESASTGTPRDANRRVPLAGRHRRVDHAHP